jgi:hypothetical protein
MQCLSCAAAPGGGLHVYNETMEANPNLPQLQLHLQSVGVALTSFAQPIACNNPLCSNVAGPSEALLVQGKTSRCSGCRAARYCGKACQVSHWKQHKHVHMCASGWLQLPQQQGQGLPVRSHFLNTEVLLASCN